MANYSRFSTLLDIASMGQLNDLKSLVSESCSIDVTDTTGKTALWIAMEKENTTAVETLLQAGADVNKTYNSEQTPLMFAVDKGCTEYVQVLLDAGANIDSVDSNGMSAIMIAAQRGNLDCLQMLITAGANLNLCDIHGKTALMIAVEENRCDYLKCLIEAGAHVHNHDFQDSLPIMTAVHHNCKRCLQTFFKAGALVNAADGSGKTALVVAIERESSTLPLLIQMGANLNLNVGRGKTPIMLAASKGLVNSLQLLVQAGADLDQVDEEGQTALMMAAYEGQRECIKCLINGGARQDLQDTNGRTALMLAASKGYYECLQVLRAEESWRDLQCKDGKTALIYAVEALYEDSRLILLAKDLTISDDIASIILSRTNTVQCDDAIKCVQILLETGANPGICGEFGLSPLMYAARLDTSAKFYKLLIDAGSDINMTDNSDSTALVHAVHNGNWEYVRKLVVAGASVNIVSRPKETPLTFLTKSTVMGGKQVTSSLCSTIAHLLNHGADVNVGDYEGMTPLMWAAKSSSSIMSLLIKHGAKIDMTDEEGFSALYHTFDSDNNIEANTRYLLDQGANPNIITADGRSGISVAIQRHNPALLEFLIKSNVDPAITWWDFKYLVNDKKMLQLMALNGAMPLDICQHQSEHDDRVSFLKQALDSECLDIAKFCLASGYLSPLDITCRNAEIVNVFKIEITVKGCFTQRTVIEPLPHLTSFLESVHSQPWPLVKLCFVAVSSMMGGGTEKERKSQKFRSSRKNPEHATFPGAHIKTVYKTLGLHFILL